MCACRCGGLIRSRNTHRVHSSDRVRVDGTDQSHSPYNDRRYISQCRGSEPPAFDLRLHHTHQKTTVPARARLGTPRVSIRSSIHPASHSSLHPSIHTHTVCLPSVYQDSDYGFVDIIYIRQEFSYRLCTSMCVCAFLHACMCVC